MAQGYGQETNTAGGKAECYIRLKTKRGIVLASLCEQITKVLLDHLTAINTKGT